MRISFLGAGAWGTAMAIQAAQRHDVLLWARDAGQAQTMRLERSNHRYLPGCPLPEALRLTHDLQLALSHAQHGLVVVATPMSGLRAMLESVDPRSALLWLCKGLEDESGLIGHELAERVRPGGLCGVLSGPSFASEVAQGLPTALVAASRHDGVLDRAVTAFHAQTLRIYTSGDPIGVEVGGAVKNVMAIAAGVSDGMGLGLNSRAALITRGLAEMTRLGLAMGARAETFTGLSGLGDLVLTATGDLSRNRRVGVALAQGQTCVDILAQLGHVAEGVYSARSIAQRARGLGLEMPITDAVVSLLDGRLTPAQALQQLLQREVRPES